jgi:Flp pilus assembly protein TadG
MPVRFRRLALSPPRGRRTRAPADRHHTSGQAIAELAIVVPVIFLILLAIADLGRVYTSAVAVEAAGREAADYGSFDATQWTAANAATTVQEMKRRACVAAKGSHLEGYAQSDPADDSTCTNPMFTCTLEHGGSSAPCDTSGGIVGGADCSMDIKTTNPACTVHVHLDYDFRTFFAIPPMPETIALGRDSFFRVASLGVAP